jgi:succinate dehydrogenase/fumarate reductase-like Fe-S protein
MTERAILLIRRGAAGEEPRWSRFEIAYQPGESVLDGVRRLRAESDPTLAMRFSCLNANACKECVILIDGETHYACTARLEPREMRLEPLPNKRLVRDLVTEIAPPDERLPNTVRPTPYS